MPCRHGAGPPASCSQCLGFPARRVEQVGAELAIDGAIVRPIEPGMSPAMTRYRQRGNAHRRKATP